MKIKITHTLIALCLLALTSLGHAQSFVGLRTGGISLTTFGTKGVTSAPIPINGLGNDSIVDLDYFSSGNGQLFGLGTSGTLYSITLNGLFATATVNSGPVYTPNAGETATSLGTPTVMDFNPAVDRLRVYSGTTNYRITPGSGILNEDGQLAYEAGDAQFGMTPNLVAAAYINNFDGAATTTLYSIDATFNTLVVNIIGPEFSTLRTQDTLTLNGMVIDFGNATGFDVLTMGGVNTAYVSNGNVLYTVTLNMGMPGAAAGDLTLVSTLSGPGAGITDFAVVPEPSTYALLAVGLLALGVYAARRSRADA